ncbi:MAG: hypothetical protein ACI4TD_12655 [Phocaeicola sp.]
MINHPEIIFADEPTGALNKSTTETSYEDISYGIKLCAGNIGMNDNLYTFP